MRLSFGFLRRSCALLCFAAVLCFGGLRLQKPNGLLEGDRFRVDVARNRGEQAIVPNIGSVAPAADRDRLAVFGMSAKTAAAPSALSSPAGRLGQEGHGAVQSDRQDVVISAK